MSYKPSKLLPVGLALLALAFILPAGVDMVIRVLQPTDPSSSGPSLIGGSMKIVAGLSQLLFFVAGFSCAIIGGLKNRKAWKGAGVVEGDPRSGDLK